MKGRVYVKEDPGPQQETFMMSLGFRTWAGLAVRMTPHEVDGKVSGLDILRNS